MKKQIVSLFLALALLCSLLPHLSFVASAEIINGRCGDNLNWTLDTKTMTMTITGSGSMWEGAGPGLDFQQWGYQDKIKTLVISGATNITPIFSYMDSLETLKILDSVASIQVGAFCWCEKLKTVQLPNSLTTIEAGAFENCTALTAITIPDSVKSIGEEAFYNCSSLKSASIAAKSIGVSAFRGCTQLETVTLATGVEQIGTTAFAECNKLSSITIPASMKNIGEMAFYLCTGLKTIKLSEGLKKLGNGAFYCCGVTEITIPSSITAIDSSSFSWCAELTSVTIQEGTTSIGGDAFSFCHNLKNVTIPDTMKTIGAFAFEYCSSLTKITIPTSVTSIDEYAFMGCNLMTSVIIPKNVKCIGTQAFGYSEGQKKNITIHGEENTEAQRYANANGFKFVPYVCFCDVPANSYYANAVAWAVKNGITGGVNSLHFGSKKNCTREQVVTFLWAAKGCPEPQSDANPFKDVKKNSWFRKSVLWAVEQGVTGGVDDTHFGVGKACDRAQVVMFLWAAAGKPEPETAENKFTDVKKKDYFYSAVLWAVENGVTGGTTPTTFSPKNICTRAQVVTFLYAAYADK